MVEHQFVHQSEGGSDGPPPGPGVTIDELRHAAAVLSKTDWDELPGDVVGELIEPFGEVRNTMDAVHGDMVAAYDSSGAWRRGGSRTCSQRVAYRLRIPPSEAGRELRRGHTLLSMPATHRAFSAGEITVRHADRLIRANRSEHAEAFGASEADLIEQARRRPYPEWERLVTRWERLVDAETAERTADQQTACRSASATTTEDGMGRIGALLDPMGNAEWRAEYDRIEAALFDADWAEARARLGDKATPADLARTPEQRRADAHLEMARRSAACDVDGFAPSAKFVVNIHTDQTTLLQGLAALTGADPSLLPDDLDGGPVTESGRRFCETADGAPLAVTDMVLAALCGRVRRVLYDADGRLIDHGRSQRLFTGSLRDAVIARARTCAHPDCELPASRCEIDHRQSWKDLGHTNADNGDPDCDHHNRWKDRHPDLWRQALDQDRRRRNGSGLSTDPRINPPTPRPDPPMRR